MANEVSKNTGHKVNGHWRVNKKNGRRFWVKPHKRTEKKGKTHGG